MRRAFPLVMVLLVLIAGCMTIDYRAEQEFRGDGTSILKIDEYMGVSPNVVDGLHEVALSDPSNLAPTLLLEYYTTKNYPDTLCGLMSNVECFGDDNGYLHVEVTLEPGEFYEIEKEMDWLNLKEVMTFKIEKVPMGKYFTYEENSEEVVQVTLVQDAVEYALANVDTHLTDDYYCVERSYSTSTDVSYRISSLSGGKATIKITGQPYYDLVHVNWVGCSNDSYGRFTYMEITHNISEARGVFEAVQEINITLARNETTTVTVDCPTNAQTIVVFYETDYGIEELGICEIITKETLKQAVEESIEENTGYYTFAGIGTPPPPPDELFLNFKEGKIVGKTFYESGLTYGLDVTIEYTAKFPGTLVGAEMGNETIGVINNEVRLTLNELRDLSESNTLIVTVEKEHSPLGATTWVIVLAVVVLLLVYFFLRRR